MKVSAVIIAFNEEQRIAGAIRSVSWADEILVVDSQSEDRTRDIAEGLGARVIVRPWPGFAEQKQFATDQAKHDWIFSLDADELVTEELQEEIEKLREVPPAHSGYRIPRLSIYMDREIRHGGWYPDFQMRFFDRRRGSWSRRAIHESFELHAGHQYGRISNHILHYSVEGPGHHAEMISTRYAPLSALQMYNEGIQSGHWKAVFSAIAAFVKGYFLRLGFLDGFPGLVIAYFAAHNVLLKHLILLNMHNIGPNHHQVGPATTISEIEPSNLP